MSVKTRKAVITGSSKGIGKAIAERFAQENINIYLLTMYIHARMCTSCICHVCMHTVRTNRYVSQVSVHETLKRFVLPGKTHGRFILSY